MSVHSFTTAIGPCSIWWEDDVITRFMLLTEHPDSEPVSHALAPLVVRVQKHLCEGGEDFDDVPLAWEQVSSFQARVYRAALEVKSGQTATYGDLARAIGEAPAVSRAVGTALGQNPWPLLVPCHRFVGVNGKMTGFSAPGGIDTKLKLLAIEGDQLFDV
ncbi:MAG: methylated-DNA--[protein]-cysteine S-methyltransferase [Synoicihabitans sp.]